MTIDVSNLSPEKRAWLKANPDLLKSIEAEVPRQVAGFEARHEKANKGKASWQRDIDDALKKAEEIRRQYDPLLMEINQRFIEKTEGSVGTLVCPVCGDSDKGNVMNGKPWCFKCNSPLLPSSRIHKMLKSPRIKVSNDKWGLK